MTEQCLQAIDLVNKAGFRVSLLDYGATISSIMVPVDGRHLSPDGDQGFPGKLAVSARYSLRRARAWRDLCPQHFV